VIYEILRIPDRRKVTGTQFFREASYKLVGPHGDSQRAEPKEPAKWRIGVKYIGRQSAEKYKTEPKGIKMAEGNQYLYLLQANRLEMLVKGATPEEEVILDEHFDYLQNLLVQNVLILAGRTLNSDPTTFGIVIFKASSLLRRCAHG